MKFVTNAYHKHDKSCATVNKERSHKCADCEIRDSEVKLIKGEPVSECLIGGVLNKGPGIERIKHWGFVGLYDVSMMTDDEIFTVETNMLIAEEFKSYILNS